MEIKSIIKNILKSYKYVKELTDERDELYARYSNHIDAVYNHQINNLINNSEYYKFELHIFNICLFHRDVFYKGIGSMGYIPMKDLIGYGKTNEDMKKFKKDHPFIIIMEIKNGKEIKGYLVGIDSEKVDKYMEDK